MEGEISGTGGIEIAVSPSLTRRNRLTCFFRPILAIPHVLLVGGPAALVLSFGNSVEGRPFVGRGIGAGVLGAVAAVCAMIAWFAIVFGMETPRELWRLSAYYLRWRVRAVAYFALLRDEYPPFGDAPYPAEVSIAPPTQPRDRVGVAFRIFLAIPHLIVVSLLGIAWAFATVVAWFSILLSGEYPEGLYRFSVGVLRWSTRVEAYLLLLRDEYPPFSLG